MVDFEVYRTAGIRALHAEPLYRPDDGHYQFKYLPAYAFAMAPFAVVDDQVARLAWFALSFGLLCAFVRASARAVPERRLTDGALITLAILLAGKFYGHELVLGQSNILLATVLLAALLASEAGMTRTAGVLLALGVIVKPYALLLLPWLWLVAGIPAVLSAVVTLAAALLLPALAYGWSGNLDQMAAWYGTVTRTTGPLLLATDNVSFAALWAKWIGVGSAAETLTIITSAAAAAMAVLIVARRRGVREPAYLEFGVLMLLVPLLSPQGWDYVLLMATPAFLVVVDRWRETTVPWRALTVLAFAGLSFTFYDLLGRRLYVAVMGIDLIGICAAVLLVCLVNLRIRKLA